jgi:hypothetical protein
LNGTKNTLVIKRFSIFFVQKDLGAHTHEQFWYLSIFFH